MAYIFKGPINVLNFLCDAMWTYKLICTNAQIFSRIKHVSPFLLDHIRQILWYHLTSVTFISSFNTRLSQRIQQQALWRKRRALSFHKGYACSYSHILMLNSALFSCQLTWNDYSVIYVYIILLHMRNCHPLQGKWWNCWHRHDSLGHRDTSWYVTRRHSPSLLTIKSPDKKT